MTRFVTWFLRPNGYDSKHNRSYFPSYRFIGRVESDFVKGLENSIAHIERSS